MESKAAYMKVILDMNDLKPSFKDVKFWYKRKSFPKLEDYGTADIDLSSGSGARIKIVWKIESAPERAFALSLMNVKCTIDKMNVHVIDAKHNILDKIASTVFIGSIKKGVAQGIVDSVVGFVQPLNDQMNQWFATRPIESVKEKANEAFQEAFEKTNEAVKNSKEAVHDAYEVAKVKVNAAAENLKERAEDLKEDLKDKIETGKEVVSDAKSAMDGKFTSSTTSSSVDPDSLEASFPKSTASKDRTDPEKISLRPEWDSKWNFENPDNRPIINSSNAI